MVGKNIDDLIPKPSDIKIGKEVLNGYNFPIIFNMLEFSLIINLEC